MKEATKNNCANQDLARVLVVEPGKVPYEAFMKLDDETLKHAVGGNLDAYLSGDFSIACICNMDREELSLPLNRILLDENWEVFDVILGKFIVARLDKECRYTALTDEDFQYYMDFFYVPVKIVYRDGYPEIAYDLGVE